MMQYMTSELGHIRNLFEQEEVKVKVKKVKVKVVQFHNDNYMEYKSNENQ